MMRFPLRAKNKQDTGNIYQRMALCAGFMLCFIFAPFNSAFSQTITIDQPIDFGKFVLVDNAAGRTIELLPGGGFTSDPEYQFFSNPQMGTVTVDGYAPGVSLTVVITDTTVANGGSANFSTSSPFTVPASITTDGFGEATFDIGATLTSDGSGSKPVDGTFNGTFTVTVSTP